VRINVMLTHPCLQGGFLFSGLYPSSIAHFRDDAGSDVVDFHLPIRPTGDRTLKSALLHAIQQETRRHDLNTLAPDTRSFSCDRDMDPRFHPSLASSKKSVLAVTRPGQYDQLGFCLALRIPFLIRFFASPRPRTSRMRYSFPLSW
jgi:hypothetical protein